MGTDCGRNNLGSSLGPPGLPQSAAGPSQKNGGQGNNGTVGWPALTVLIAAGGSTFGIMTVNSGVTILYSLTGADQNSTARSLMFNFWYETDAA